MNNAYQTLYVADGLWTSRSALHIGNGDGDSAGVDMPLLADAAGSFFVQGSSIAGAARNYLARQSMPSAHYEGGLGNEPPWLKLLFGAGDEYASLLSVSDGLAISTSTLSPTIRDGVRIEASSSTAYESSEGGAKFDVEVLPAGFVFHLRLELRIPESMPHRAAGKVSLEQLEAGFRGILDGFGSRDAIRLGARTRRGYGAGSVTSWSLRRLDLLGNSEHFIAWLKRDGNAGVPLAIDDLPTSRWSGDRRRFEIAVSLELVTSLLVRSAGTGAREPDAMHLTEHGVPILPGTSLGGVLRHRCHRIAKIIVGGDEADVLLKGMFGSLYQPKDKPQENESVAEPVPALRASRVMVEEVPLQDGSIDVHTRVAIDRFTQGSLETRLFDESPVWPMKSADGHVRNLRITLDGPRTSECEDPKARETRFHREVALLLMAFKDLWAGDLPVGGAASAGRGVFRGKRARITVTGLAEPLSLHAESVDDLSQVRREGREEDWKVLETWVRDWSSKENKGDAP